MLILGKRLVYDSFEQKSLSLNPEIRFSGPNVKLLLLSSLKGRLLP